MSRQARRHVSLISGTLAIRMASPYSWTIGRIARLGTSAQTNMRRRCHLLQWPSETHMSSTSPLSPWKFGASRRPWMMNWCDKSSGKDRRQRRPSSVEYLYWPSTLEFREQASSRGTFADTSQAKGSSPCRVRARTGDIMRVANCADSVEPPLLARLLKPLATSTRQDPNAKTASKGKFGTWSFAVAGLQLWKVCNSVSEVRQGTEMKHVGQQALPGNLRERAFSSARLFTAASKSPAFFRLAT